MGIGFIAVTLEHTKIIFVLVIMMLLSVSFPLSVFKVEDKNGNL